MFKKQNFQFAGQGNFRAETGLNRVTLCCVTSSQRELSEMAMVRSQRDLSFGKVLYLSDLPPQNSQIDHIKIAAINSREDYNSFILHELHKYIETEFVLVIQYDGFVINPKSWQESFLEYDYIGARWPWYEENSVGNGGFSLRSKRLLGATASELFKNTEGSEDDLICRRFRTELERNYNIRFAPPQVADVFSVEFAVTSAPSFGFHGLHRLHQFYNENELGHVISLLDDALFKGNPVLLWLQRMYEEGAHTHLGALTARIQQFQSADQITENCKMYELDPLVIQSIIQRFTQQKKTTQKIKISTIINYCSNDYKFLASCIRSVQKFSHEIVVSHCDHFFNGEIEDQTLISRSIKENPQAKFVEFPFTPGLYDNTTFWHNRGRAEAYQALKDKDFDWLLVLDADEVADPIFESFVKLLDNMPYDSMRILSYWYYREVYWQALQYEDSAVLIRNSPKISFGFFENSLNERLGILHGRATSGVHAVGDDGPKPLFHHYSWARNKAEMIRKVKGWAHKNDRNWLQLIENEFERDFDEKCQDYVHGYSYRKVDPFF